MALTLSIENNIASIIFDDDDSKVNVLNADALMRLKNILNEVARKSDCKALIISSKKDGCFIAGADIKEIEKIVEPDDGAEKAKAGQDIMNAIEDLSMPTIAVIDGVALGGGCELALACDYRISTFNPKVKIGLPEVNLGFIPGFGGTYRLVRLVGLQKGFKMILSGKPIAGEAALKMGLFDKMYPAASLDASVAQFTDDVIAGNYKCREKKPKGLNAILEGTKFGHKIVFSQSRKSVLKLTKGQYPAPLKAIDVIEKTLYCGREEGMAIEREAFGLLAITDISKNLVNVFYASEKCRKVSVGVKGQDVSKAGVLGAGIMGGGIAQLLSSRDIWTRVKDINYDALALGLRSAKKVYSQAVKRRRYSKAEADVKMGHISTTLDYSGFGQADIVIEAVLEKMDVKKQVFKELSDNVSPECILASNTSALSVTEMATEVKHPENVIGFHFFNPVHRMPLVEIITTAQTSQETLATSLQLVKKLGKTPIVVKDSPGFVVNRILLVYMAEAARILTETGRLEEIDKIMTDFGMPMGPFLLSDEVGLDVGLKVMQILHDAFSDRFLPEPLFEDMLVDKLLGRKTQKGFYIHGKKRSVNQKVLNNLEIQEQALDHEESLKRMVYLMINEAAMCLDEKIVDDVESIDIGMIFGTGFPPFRGGLLRYADSLGASYIVGELLRMNEKYQTDRFTPSAYLNDLKRSGNKFYE